MPRPWSRKRRDRDGGEGEEPPPAREANDKEHLDDERHAWWAQADVADAWKPRPPRAARSRTQSQSAPHDEPRDILAEHFGEDWRTSFLYSPPTEEELEEERRRAQQGLDDQDPYKVLQVADTATWDEIVAAHRSMARLHHPDRLVGQPEEAQADAEERIRVINQAYAELRIRRGM